MFTYKQAEEILNAKNYESGGEMRGRQSFNPLEKMGLAYIGAEKKIVITSFGETFLSENYDLGEVFSVVSLNGNILIQTLTDIPRKTVIILNRSLQHFICLKK